MAEFCLECYNKYCLPKGYEPRTKKQVVLDRHLDLCEGCGEMKRTVICERRSFLHRLFRL